MTAPRRLPRATPESQGVSPRGILAFVDRLEREIDEPHSFMLLRNGHVVAEGWWDPYRAELPHMLFSLSKSFTSTAVGMAVAEGVLSLDEPVVGFFPADLPEDVGPNLAAMRVRHLLTMTTGHDADSMEHLEAAADGNWARAFLARPVEHAPGTHFLYDTGATYMLSAIVQLRTGQKLAAYLRPRLFEPLGIEDADWEEDPRGVNTGGFGLSLTTEDVAAFGQLCLQEGEWHGRRLVDRGWLAEATAKQVDNGTDPASDWAQGYGFQFWRCRHGAYRGDGAFGQYCIVMPDQRAVLVMTGGLADMQVPLEVVWGTLLPALQPEPMPPDEPARVELEARLRGLRLPWPEGAASAPTAAAVSGRTYELEPNELHVASLRLDFGGDGASLTTTDPRGTHRLEFGHGCVAPSRTAMFERPRDFVGAGAWTADDTYAGLARANRTPFRYALTFRFSGDRVAATIQVNVGFGTPPPVTLEGVAS